MRPPAGAVPPRTFAEQVQRSRVEDGGAIEREGIGCSVPGAVRVAPREGLLLGAQPVAVQSFEVRVEVTFEGLGDGAVDALTLPSTEGSEDRFGELVVVGGHRSPGG
jgi:hypothetical protein